MDDLHPLVGLLVAALAAARLTRLVVTDTVVGRPRAWVMARLAKHPKVVEGLECPWCVGWWIALGTTVAVLAAPSVGALVCAPWAVAQAAWWFGGWWMPEDDDEDEG